MKNNVTNELILEHLKRIHSEIFEIKSRMDVFSTELRSTKTFMGSVKHDIAALVEISSVGDTATADLIKRVDRIERRLDLTDVPAE